MVGDNKEIGDAACWLFAVFGVPPKLYRSFQNCRGTVPELASIDFNILPCSCYSVYPTMQVLLLSTLFILATALAYRDPGFCINCPCRAVVCYHKDSFVISRALSPSLERIPSLFLCANRRMRQPPRVKLNLDLSLPLLLAGDVSLNPGPVHQTFASEQSMPTQ